MKQIELHDDTVNAAYVCQVEGDAEFYAVVMFVEREHHGKKTFHTLEQARSFAIEWL